MLNRRPPKPGERVTVGGRRIEVPGVAAMTDAASPPAEPEKPDELPEELTRMVKTAYQ